MKSRAIQCRLQRQSLPPRRPPRRVATHAWLRPIPNRPRYYELLSRLTIEQKTMDEWKELARGSDEVGTQHTLTWKSAILFFKGFILYHVIPLSLRYIWYRFSKFIRLTLLYPLQKRWALLDARLDAVLAKAGGQGYRFSRTMVSMRLHGKIGPVREVRYRWGLLMGKDVDHCTELFRLHPPANAAATQNS